MKIIKITPRGYCHGVVNAINTITNLDHLSMKLPVYILGMVIHNKQMVNSLENLGFITLHDPSKTRLEHLDSIDSGTVIFTAHGVSPEVYKKAEQKGLDIIDTTCDDVFKSQNVMKDYINKGYDVIYIGKHTHPESEAAQGISEKIHIIESISDLDPLKIKNDKLIITNQTTMSIYDVFNISEKIKEIYPKIEFINEICSATRIRQEAISDIPEEVDHVYVVGDKLSNNSKKLVEVANIQGKKSSSLIESITDIDIQELSKYKCVAVSSGASTPTKVTSEVIKFLEQFDKNDKSTYDTTSHLTIDNLITKKVLS